MNTPENTEARRLIEAALDEDQAPAAIERPGVRPDIAELLARHADEARHYRTTPYEPERSPAPVVRPSEPTPAWAKGVALTAPTVGGGVWIASQGVSGVMNAASPELAVCLGVGGLFMWLVGRSAAKRGPRKTVTNNDYRGSTINNRSSRGITYKSNN